MVRLDRGSSNLPGRIFRPLQGLLRHGSPHRERLLGSGMERKEFLVPTPVFRFAMRRMASKVRTIRFAGLFGGGNIDGNTAFSGAGTTVSAWAMRLAARLLHPHLTTVWHRQLSWRN